MKRPARAAPEAWEGRKPVQTVFLTLPRPPSVNGLYKNVPGHGRAPTKLYRQWIVAASTEVMMQRPGCVRGTYHIEIVCQRSNDQADLNNLWKAVEDALKSWGVIQDDRLCASSAARWRGRGRAMTVRVTATKGDDENGQDI